MSNTKYLEESLTLFENGESRKGIEKLSSGLSFARNKMNEQEWKIFIEDIKNGSLVKTAIKCPFTEHAVLRPSGYPGDAGLIDHIYGYKSPVLDDFTKAIYSFTTNSPSSRAVRYRRYLMSILIDKTIHLRGETASILAVACGHLRELDLCRTLLNIRPKRFIALDQDIESLKEVEKCFSKYGVSTLQKDIKNLIVGKIKLDGLDLIYSSGLYDYLSEEVARRLTNQLFKMLAPQGTLVIANFLPQISGAGYMEAVMDWWLIYRNEEDMKKLIIDLPINEIESLKQYRDPDDNITFLEIKKA